jgi:TorA maturation chaperone TorD
MVTDRPDINIIMAYKMILYFAGSMITYEPSRECITDFWGKGMIRNLPVYSANPMFIKASSQLRDSCTDNEKCLKLLTNDYRRLFASKDAGLAPAYESFFSGNNTGNHKALTVSEYYQSFGWTPHFNKITESDHLGIELLFLTHLIEKYAGIEDDACRREMQNEIVWFIDNHLLSWLPEWNKKMQDNSISLCYKGIGNLIVAASQDLRSIFINRNRDLAITGNIKN